VPVVIIASGKAILLMELVFKFTLPFLKRFLKLSRRIPAEIGKQGELDESSSPRPRKGWIQKGILKTKNYKENVICIYFLNK
jgi:hypothetical protein